MPWIKTSRRASVTGPIPNRTTAHSRGSARSSALARLALAILLGSAPARAASDDPFEPPPRKLDFLHMRFEVTLTEDDMQARRMHGVVTYWIRPKFEGSLNPGSESVTRIELDAVDLDIESVEQAGPRALPEWHARRPPPIEWPGSEAESAARGLVFRPAAYHADGNRLAIELDRPCAPEQGVWVRIRYVAENPRTGLHFVRPDADHPERPTIVYTNAEPIQARYWLPCRDWPDARWASDVLLTVPAGYTGISVGEPVGDPVASPASDDPRAAATRTFHWHQSYPIDPHLLGFAVGKFIELRFPPARALSPENTNATKQPDVFAYVQPGAVEAARFSLRRVPEMIAYYAELTGTAYPFPRYAHVTIPNHFHGGMEHAGFSMIAPTKLSRGERGHVLEETGQYNYIAHMLAHEWFAGIVTNRNLREAWLNEGFGTYLHQLWRIRADSHDAFIADMQSRTRRIRRGGRGAPIMNPGLRMPARVYSFGGGKIYWKGAWVLHMLRHQLGDKAFWSAVRSYLATHRRRGNVTTADLRRAFEEASGSDLERFFEQWIYRSGVPELNIKYAWDAERRTAVVQIAQKQPIDEHNPAFEFPLDLYFCNRAHDRLETVAVNSASHTFEFKFDQPPAVFCVDPNAGLLAALRQHKPAALWRNQVRQGPTALVRERAVRKLQSTKDTAAIELLREALFDESEYRGVRQAAAGALPSIADEETCLAALLDLERGGINDARLRSTVVRLLGDFESSPKAYAAVLRHTGNDEHIRVQAAALTALGRFAEDVRTEAAVRAAAAAAVPGNSRYVRRPAVELLGEIGTPGALETLLPAMQSHDRDSLFMMQRLVPLLVDWAEPSPPERARVETYLLMLLSDARPAVRALAAEGLGRVGEAATIDRLSGLAETDGDGTVRRRAQAAIEAIRERDAQEPR